MLIIVKKKRTESGEIYGAAGADVTAREGGGETAATAVSFGPSELNGAVDDGEAVWVDQGGPVQEPERGQGRVVGWVLRQLVDVPLFHLCHYFFLQGVK